MTLPAGSLVPSALTDAVGPGFVAALPRGPARAVVVSVATDVSGRVVLHARVWIQRTATARWEPTRAGVEVRPAELAVFVRAVQRGAQSVAETTIEERRAKA